MDAHLATIDVLETELGGVERAFRGLTADEWRTPTLLRPLDEDLPHWTLYELAGHFDISIGLAWMLLANQEPWRGLSMTPGADRPVAALNNDLHHRPHRPDRCRRRALR